TTGRVGNLNLDSFSISLMDGNISKHCTSKLTTTSIQNQGVGFCSLTGLEQHGVMHDIFHMEESP
ncbi:22914_t:CDS:2, partial [Rhizophagus irregularis]